MKLTRRISRNLVPALATIAIGVTTSHAGNVLLNPSLENGSSTTQADNWTLHPVDTFRETTNVFGFTGPAMHDGLYGVKEFGGEGDLAQTNIPVYANLFYDVSGWFYHSSSQDVIANDPNSTRMRSEERRVGKECRSRWSP